MAVAFVDILPVLKGLPRNLVNEKATRRRRLGFASRFVLRHGLSFARDAYLRAESDSATAIDVA
jgi:hypothetical protein